MLVSNGNFHGQPLALALDALAMAVAELANIAERRVERLVNPNLSGGLPAFLTGDGGLNSGFMIPQYVAASLVSENKVLAHPASVDSIPTSAGQEDHVSMGNASGLKAWQVLANAERVLAIELLAGAQGVEFLAPLQPGLGVARRARARPLALAAAPRRPLAVGRHRGGRRVDPRRLARRGGRGRGRRALVSAGNGVNPRAPQSTRPYRDSALAYAALGSLVVIFAYVTGSSLLRSLAGGRRGVPARDGLHVVAGARRARQAEGALSATRSLDATVEALCGDLSAIRAPRGTELNARSWSTEAPLRMLLNNLDAEVAERPEELVVYGGTGKAARNPEALRALVRSLLSARRGRDAARPERQAGRRLPDAARPLRAS